MELFTTALGWDFLTRWAHLLFGVTWIGLLYYFNFVQAEYFKEAEGSARVDAFVKLAPRALWWFRWGAMFTFLTGLILLGFKGAGLTVDITLGAAMGIIMFLNVWLIIWPNQKILISSNEQVVAGKEALPAAAAAAPKAALASRTNTLLSAPMLFFMASSTHFSQGAVMDWSSSIASLMVGLLIIAAIEANAIFGKPGPIASVKGVIIGSLVLTLVMYIVVAALS